MTNKRKRIQPEDVVAVVEGGRIPKKDRDPKLYYYEMRHNGYDWTQPIEIEQCVVYVNYLGTLVTNRPLDLTDGWLKGKRFAYLTPTWKERRVICDKMGLN